MTPALVAIEDRPYQRDMLTAVAGVLDTGVNRIICKAPTGTGKTVTFARMLQWPALKTWLDTFDTRAGHKGCKMLVIAHREELLDQAAAQIQKINPGIMVSIEQGDRRANSYSDVVIASIQTLSKGKFKRLDHLLERHTPRIVIVDEAHHAAASTYRGALARLGFLPPVSDTRENIESVDEDDVAQMQRELEAWDRVAPQDRLLVGVTATPNRSDAVGLGCVFQSIAYSYGLKEAIADKWLVPMMPWLIATDTNLERVRVTAGDFNQRDLANAVNTDNRNRLAVRAWLDYAAGLSTIGFTVDVNHAIAMATLFREHGISAAAVSGETPRDERKGLLKAYSAGEITVLFNCMVLTEGTDLPRTSCILHLKPTKSATLYEQMTGRGLRLFPNKTECVVIDMVDIARRHSLQTAPVLYGLPPQLAVKGKRLEVVEREFDDLLKKYPGLDIGERLASLEELQIRAQALDVWKVQGLGAFGNGRALDWVKVGADSYRLRYPWQDGEETIAVERDLLGHFCVALTLRPTDGGAARQRIICTGLETSDLAAGQAEKFVLQERREVTKLASKDAHWRGNPASEKQIGYLRALGVPVKSGLTSGEASSLIGLAKTRRGQ